MTEILAVIGRVLDLILRWIKAGATDDEILARLANPAGVGMLLIAAVRRRQSALDSYIANG